MTRLAYADPPYMGQARKLYGEPETDHAALLNALSEYDGWALSCSSPSLGRLLPMLPGGGRDVRVMAWVKPFCIFKPGVNPAYAWEPVLVKPARARTRAKPTVRDWVSANVTLKRGLVGAKPEAFCYWLFEVLGAEPEDEFTDLFPGTGGVGRAWVAWRNRAR